ncbi:uncharacterized protein LOC121244202 [Juglans microcarpa x Juglans regia]|uniref:uncharacterized protein LOC121244202 n=1 Tax=Juglans microcarpa x Juglans regia TaxID=2249226 RepID=UPI001B7E9230|nr:uncharacterized protein LOC121244202 [Juglans microcarpa x Juglans regia]
MGRLEKLALSQEGMLKVEPHRRPKGHAPGKRITEVFSAKRDVSRLQRRVGGVAITFDQRDEEDILHPHDDALVVTMQVVNFRTQRILIDNGSSADILFWDTFIKMGINPDRLHPAPMPHEDFTGDVVHPVRVITLSILAGRAPRTATTMSDFLVVKAPSSYNVILGRLTLNSLKAMTSTFHLKVKFPTNSGVGEIHDKQVLPQECYDKEMRHEARVVAATEVPEESSSPDQPQS